jgi:DNA-binding NarL/FixJ family response regulator
VKRVDASLSDPVPPTVVVIDDHAMFRQALCRLIARSHRVKVIGAAESGPLGIQCARELRPDVVVTDLRMPGMRGTEVTSAIRRTMPDVQVIVLTVSDEQEDLFAALRAGALGYVLKTRVEEDIIPAILAAARRESWLSPRIARQLVDEFKQLPTVKIRERTREASTLTSREQTVLAHLAQGLRNREIASALGIAETTVKTHLLHIREKLQARNRLEAASFAHQLGLLPADPSEHELRPW